MKHKFWMVWRGRGALPSALPTTQHAMRESAEAEAARLAQKESGEVFYVLESVCEMQTEKPKVQVVEHVAAPHPEA